MSNKVDRHSRFLDLLKEIYGEKFAELTIETKKEKLTNKYTVPEMCQDCTLYYGEGWRCPVQEEPGWLYEKYGTCWSKRTDPKVDKKIAVDIERYIERYKGITI